MRYVHAKLAQALVASGAARVGDTNGKVRSIVLAQPESGFAQRIGPPEGRATGVRFTRRVHLNCGYLIVEHHSRCTYE